MARRILVLCGAALLLDSGIASPTTVLPIGFDELVSKAEVIFVGEVIDRRSVYDTGPGTPIITHVTFDVVRVIKGSGGLRTQLTFLGGQIGRNALIVSGMPHFEIGDRDVLFVSEDRTAISPLVGFWQGRVGIVRDPATGKESIRTHGAGAVANGYVPSAWVRSARSTALIPFPAEQSVPVEEFVALVRARVAAASRR